MNIDSSSYQFIYISILLGLGLSQDCVDLTDIDFGACTMVLGIGYTNDECNYVSGCNWVVDGVDYSDSFFDTVEECQDTCFENHILLHSHHINYLIHSHV